MEKLIWWAKKGHRCLALYEMVMSIFIKIYMKRQMYISSKSSTKDEGTISICQKVCNLFHHNKFYFTLQVHIYLNVRTDEFNI